MRVFAPTFPPVSKTFVRFEFVQAFCMLSSSYTSSLLCLENAVCLNHLLLTLTIFLPPFLNRSLSLERRGMKDFQFRTDNSKFSPSQHIVQFWIYCKKHHPWRRARNAIFFRCSSMSVWVILMLCSVNSYNSNMFALVHDLSSFRFLA